MAGGRFQAPWGEMESFSDSSTCGRGVSLLVRGPTERLSGLRWLRRIDLRVAGSSALSEYRDAILACLSRHERLTACGGEKGSRKDGRADEDKTNGERLVEEAKVIEKYERAGGFGCMHAYRLQQEGGDSACGVALRGYRLSLHRHPHCLSLLNHPVLLQDVARQKHTSCTSAHPSQTAVRFEGTELAYSSMKSSCSALSFCCVHRAVQSALRSSNFVRLSNAESMSRRYSTAAIFDGRNPLQPLSQLYLGMLPLTPCFRSLGEFATSLRKARPPNSDLKKRSRTQGEP